MRGSAHLDMMSRKLFALTPGIFVSDGPPSVSQAWVVLDEMLHSVVSTLVMMSPFLGDDCLAIGDGERFTGRAAETLETDYGIARGADADLLYAEFRDWLKNRCGGSFDLRAGRRYRGIRVDGKGVISVIPGRNADGPSATDVPSRDGDPAIVTD